MTKIKTISFLNAVSKLSQPVADSTHQIPQIDCVVKCVEFDSDSAPK